MPTTAGSLMPKRQQEEKYDEVPLEGGWYKRRRLGAKGAWEYMCKHDERKKRCKECGGSSICGSATSARSAEGHRYTSDRRVTFDVGPNETKQPPQRNTRICRDCRGTGIPLTVKWRIEFAVHVPTLAPTLVIWFISGATSCATSRLRLDPTSLTI